MVRKTKKLNIPGKANYYNPGALKGLLGSKWFEGVEDLYNTGVVTNIYDLEKMSPEQINQAKEEAQKIESSKDWKTKAKEFLIGEKAKEKKYEQLLPQHKAYLEKYFTQLQQLQPQELQYLQSQREMPYLQRAFGEYAPYAGALGGTLLSQLAAPQASQFTSNEPGGAGISGALLSSLLGSLIGQQPWAQQGAHQIGQYAQQYAPQALQYGQQQGQSALNYLRNLVGRGV